MSEEFRIAPRINVEGSEELTHYGVLGMRWGVRKQESKERIARGNHPSYTSDQRKRDKQIYGARGTKRINKAMNKGDSISTARGAEKTRRDRVMGRNKYVRVGGKVAGAVGAIALSNIAISQLRKATRSPAVKAFMERFNARPHLEAVGTVADILASVPGRAVVSAGAAKVGEMMSGDIAVSANMRIHGYDPSRR